jgi:hypothetical protein
VAGVTSRIDRVWLCSDQVFGGPWPAMLVAGDTVVALAPRPLWQRPPEDLYVSADDESGAGSQRWMVAHVAVDPEGQTDDTSPVAGAVRLHEPVISLIPMEREDFVAVLTGRRPERDSPGDQPGRGGSGADASARALHGIPEEDEEAKRLRKFWCLLFPWHCHPGPGGEDDIPEADVPPVDGPQPDGPQPFGTGDVD